MGYFYHLLTYSQTCIASSIHTQTCFKFWYICLTLSFLLCLIVFTRAIRNILKERADWEKYLLKVEKRNKIADPEVMAKYIWHGD